MLQLLSCSEECRFDQLVEGLDSDSIAIINGLAGYLFDRSADGIMVGIVWRVSKDYRIFLDDCSLSEVEVVDCPASYVCWFFHELSES